MKRFLSILSLLFLSSILHSQSPSSLYPIRERGLWGYIDSIGKIQIPPQFRAPGTFAEGMAPVRKDGTYGYIDTQGKLAYSSYV